MLGGVHPHPQGGKWAQGLIWVKGCIENLKALQAGINPESFMGGDKPRHYKVSANLPALSNQ